MGDVLEYLVDGTSGLAPGGNEGTAIIAGVCSKGEIGKGYLLGKSSDLNALLGVGPLVDRLRDVFATGGQRPVVIAVPVEGLPGAYIGTVQHHGTGPAATASGVAAQNADIFVEIVDSGALGTGTYRLSINGGMSFESSIALPANGQIQCGDTGVTLCLADTADCVAGDSYQCAARTSIGPVSKLGSGPDIQISGTVKAAANVVLQIMAPGGLNVGTYRFSIDGGDSWSSIRTLPADGLLPLSSLGITVTFSAQEVHIGDQYSFALTPPVPSISAVMMALSKPLSLYDVEFVHVVGPSDAADWASMGARADELWNKHRPTFFIAESRLPQDGEDLDDWVAQLKQERESYAHRFVTVCAAFGEVSDSQGQRQTRNWGGLLSGRLLSIPVMRAPGRVRDGGISQGTLPVNMTEAHQHVLEEAGYITAKHYAGLHAAYWGDERTLADRSSDFQYITVLRTVFKAVRKMRIAALKSMYDEAGGPLHEGGAAGLTFLQAQLENALNTMIAAMPQELAGYVVEIPDGQDIVNNGVAAETTLLGIPIIRQIKLFSRYAYAGGNFDPRLEA